MYSSLNTNIQPMNHRFKVMDKVIKRAQNEIQDIRNEPNFRDKIKELVNARS